MRSWYSLGRMSCSPSRNGSSLGRLTSTSPLLVWSMAHRSCYGDEAICTTAVTDRPADMMTSLVAMLPKAEKDRRYRVSVVIEELGE